MGCEPSFTALRLPGLGFFFPPGFAHPGFPFDLSLPLEGFPFGFFPVQSPVPFAGLLPINPSSSLCAPIAGSSKSPRTSSILERPSLRVGLRDCLKSSGDWVFDGSELSREEDCERVFLDGFSRFSSAKRWGGDGLGSRAGSLGKRLTEIDFSSMLFFPRAAENLST